MSQSTEELEIANALLRQENAALAAAIQEAKCNIKNIADSHSKMSAVGQDYRDMHAEFKDQVDAMPDQDQRIDDALNKMDTDNDKIDYNVACDKWVQYENKDFDKCMKVFIDYLHVEYSSLNQDLQSMITQMPFSDAMRDALGKCGTDLQELPSYACAMLRKVRLTEQDNVLQLEKIPDNKPN